MSFFESGHRLECEGVSFVTVTLVAAKGSTPQDPGAKILVTAEGLVNGTIGGGKVEAAAILKAQAILKSDQLLLPELVTWNLQRDIGMTCGGVVTFLFEHTKTDNWPIVVFGAGHISQALCRTLVNLDCQLTCIDPRKEWLDKLPSGVKALQHGHPEELVKVFPKSSYFVSMTKGHAMDVPVLYELSKHAPNTPYVGVIGSAQKANSLKSELIEMGVSQKFLERIRVPVGLPIGSNHPYEIAISIAAEMLQVRSAKGASVPGVDTDTVNTSIGED